MSTLADGLFLPGNLVLDDAYAYFGAVDGIFRVPQAGGEVELLADPLPRDIQVANGVLYWLDGRTFVESGLLQFGLFSLPTADSVEPERIAVLRHEPDSLVVVDDQIFWTTRSHGEISTVNVSGGTPRLALADELDEWALCCDLVSDGASLFFRRDGWPSDQSEKTGIWRMSLDSAEVEELALGRFIERLAVDDEFVYFTGEIENGEVGTSDWLVPGLFRVPK